MLGCSESVVMLAVEIFQIEAEQKRQNSKSGKQEHRHRIVILQWIVYAFVAVLRTAPISMGNRTRPMFCTQNISE